MEGLASLAINALAVAVLWPLFLLRLVHEGFIRHLWKDPTALESFEEFQKEYRYGLIVHA